MKLFMGRRLRLLWIGCTVVCCSVVQAQTNSYVASWLGIPVVDVTATVQVADTVIHAIYTAKTRSWFDPIYPVDNRYDVTCTADYCYPVGYSKQIIEKGNESSFSAAYDFIAGLVEYSNGLQRIFPQGFHNLLSSLLWVERHNWLGGERQDIQVEIEGSLWHVSLYCREIVEEATGSTAEVEVVFEALIGGEPVLSHTDIVTHRLPGFGRKMVFFIQLEHKLIDAIEVGRPPFRVRATRVTSTGAD